MDSNKPPSDGNELWRLLQGDTPEAGEESPPADAAPDVPARPAPGRRAPVASFPDPEWRDEEQQGLGSSAPNPGSDNYIAQESSGSGAPVSTDTSQLQKILAADVDADFEYRPVNVAVDDVDRAVREFHRGAVEVVHCRKHPERESAAQCPVCQAFFCQECVTVRRGRLLCRDCADAEYAPSEEEILAALEEGRDAPAAADQIGEKERPEFEVGGSFLGGEGRPTNTLWQLLAWALDFALVRGLLLLGVLLGGAMLADNPHPLLHMLDGDTFAEKQQAVIATLLLGQPLLKVLPLLLGLDFLYQFACLVFFNRTIGMSWVGMRVATEWGDYAPFSACAVRSIVASALLGGPAILIGLLFPDYRGIHDMAAGTLVINYNGLKRVDAYETVTVKRG